jgi:RHS repeat-associated protein
MEIVLALLLDRLPELLGELWAANRHWRREGKRITLRIDESGDSSTMPGSSNRPDYTCDGTRLVTTARNGATNSAYTYDLNDNRLSLTVAAGTTTTTATYDDEDHLLRYGDGTYAYSSRGTLNSRTDTAGTTDYKYDIFGSLLRVTLPSGKVIEYVVDAKKRRIAKNVNGNVVQGFLYSSDLRVAAELDSTGSVLSRFAYATSSPLPSYMTKNGATYRLISDHLGSPRLVVDVASGAILQRIDYDEFGNVEADTNPGFQPFGFAGGLYDPDTKLVRFGARDYDPSTGRWTAKDPLLFRGNQTNLYNYALGDPVNYVDTTGTLTIPFVGWVDAGENLGTAALSSYADILADPSAGWLARGGAALGGLFSALWTPCTSDRTFATLLAAEGAGRYAARPFWRYLGPQSGADGAWLSRGAGWSAPYGSDFAAAQDALQLPATPTSVIEVQPPWWQPVAGPRSATAFPNLGAGGGTEYYRGGLSFP